MGNLSDWALYAIFAIPAAILAVVTFIVVDRHLRKPK
jgi:hypothetical protein